MSLISHTIDARFVLSILGSDRISVRKLLISDEVILDEYLSNLRRIIK